MFQYSAHTHFKLYQSVKLLIVLLLFFLLSDLLVAQSITEKRWNQFLESHSGIIRRPQDDKIGSLVDIRDMDSSWAEAIDVCEKVFSSIESSSIPEDVFLGVTRFPLRIAFAEILESDNRTFVRHYGVPERNDNRITVPIRLGRGKATSYGYVYLMRVDTDWFVEQWALDLSSPPIVETQENVNVSEDIESIDKEI